MKNTIEPSAQIATDPNADQFCRVIAAMLVDQARAKPAPAAVKGKAKHTRNK